MAKLWGVKVFLLSPQTIDQSLTTANVGNVWEVQCVTQLEPNASKNPRGGKAKWRQDLTWSWAIAAAVEQLRERRSARTSRNTKKG